MKRIVAGTTNRAKSTAMRTLLAPAVEIIAPPISAPPALDESGSTVTDVATAKATTWANWLAANDIRLPVIVTDGGLTIPALPNWDPTRTRRFAGEGRTPLQIAHALLERASRLAGEDRIIGWTESAVLVLPDGRAAAYEAESPPGVLATTVRAGDLDESDGFWLPAIWLCPEFRMKRLVDLTEEERLRRPDHWDRLGTALRGEVDAFLSSAIDDQRQL